MKIFNSTISVTVDNKQAINALGKQEAQYAALNTEVKALEKDVRAYNKAQTKLNTKGIDKNSKAYKNAQKTVQDLQKSVDRYTDANAQIDQLTDSIDKQRKSLGLQGQTLAQLTRRQKQLSKAIRTTATEGTEAYEEMTKELQDLNKEINRQNKNLRATGDQATEIDKATVSIEKQTKTVELQEGSLDHLIKKQKELRKVITSTVKEGSKGYEEMTKELQNLNKEIELQNKKINSTGEQAPKIEKVKSRFGGMKDILSDIASTGGRLGLIGVIVSGVVLLSKEVLALEKEFTKLRKTVARFSGATGNELGMITAQAKALSTTFDQDVNEVITTANNLAQQMGISFDDALGLIEQGFLQGADSQGDFLSKVREYPIQFKQAGLSAEEFIKIASQEAKAGIFDDKLLDSIKEIGLRLREMTPAAKSALEPLGGKFVDQIVSDLNTGKKDIVTIFGEIITRAKELGLTTQQTQTLIADLGGGPLEDLGGLEEAFKQLDAAMKINLDTTDELGASQKETLEIQKQMDGELERLTRNFEGLSQTISNDLNAALADDLALINDLTDAFNKYVRGIDNSISSEDKRVMSLNKLRGEYDLLNGAITNLTAKEKELSSRDQSKQVAESLAETRARLKELQNELTVLVPKLTKAEDANTAALEAQRDAVAANIEGTTIRIEKEKELTKTTISKTEAERLAREEEARRLKQRKEAFNQLKAESELIESLSVDTNTDDFLSLPEPTDEKQPSFLEAFGLIPTDEEKAKADKAQQDARARLAFRQQLIEETRQLDIQNAVTDAERVELMRQEELRKVNEHFDVLRAQAVKYGLDTKQVFEARAKAIAGINNSFRAQQEEADKTTFAARAAAAKTFVSTLEGIATSLAQLGVKSQGFQKSLALTQIGIDTASAISSTISAASKAGTVPGIIAQIAIGLGTVLGNFAKAKSVLSSTKDTTAPKFAKGGLAKGPSHAQGGMPGWVKGTGAIEFQGGEYITRREATARNLGIIDTINKDAGRTQFALVPQYAVGGAVSPMAARATPKRYYNDGGQIPTPQQSNEQQPTNNTELAAQNRQLNATLQQLSQVLVMLQNSPLRAYITTDDFNNQVDEKTDLDQIEQDVNL